MRVCCFQPSLAVLERVVFPSSFPCVLTAMACSVVQLARRALVKFLLALAAACSVAVSVTQQSSDAQVGVAYRRIVKVVHPDKGGKVEDAQAAGRQRKVGSCKARCRCRSASRKQGSGATAQVTAQASRWRLMGDRSCGDCGPEGGPQQQVFGH